MILGCIDPRLQPPLVLRNNQPDMSARWFRLHARKSPRRGPFQRRISELLVLGALGVCALSPLVGCAPTASPSASPAVSSPAVETRGAVEQAPVAGGGTANVEARSGPNTRGDPGAPVTIVEFADYQCPYCAQEEPTLERLLRHYQPRVRLVFRDYPIHEHSVELAEAARCAGEQGGFWAMHDFLFKHVETVSVGYLSIYATALGLDGPALAACVGSGRYQKAIAADRAAAEKAGAQGTPTFIVNGKRLDGMQTYDQLAEATNNALATRSAADGGPASGERR